MRPDIGPNYVECPLLNIAQMCSMVCDFFVYNQQKPCISEALEKKGISFEEVT